MYEGQQARTTLVSANGGLVTSIAKRHYSSLKQATEAGGGVGTILTLQDMIQEGNLGLMQAAERFEPERGWRFSTYATYWVKQRILRSISDSSRIIRLPAHGK
jgi:RNA polymerase primary sigma factor